MNVSRSPISCSSASSDRLWSAPKTMALNVITASRGLRPAGDLRSASGFRQTASSTGRKVLPRDQFPDHRRMPSPLLLQLPPPAFGRHVRKTQLSSVARLCHRSSSGFRCPFQLSILLMQYRTGSQFCKPSPACLRTCSKRHLSRRPGVKEEGRSSARATYRQTSSGVSNEIVRHGHRIGAGQARDLCPLRLPWPRPCPGRRQSS